MEEGRQGKVMDWRHSGLVGENKRIQEQLVLGVLHVMS